MDTYYTVHHVIVSNDHPFQSPTLTHGLGLFPKFIFVDVLTVPILSWVLHTRIKLQKDIVRINYYYYY